VVTPQAFELQIEVRPEDIDGLGHVNNVVYLRWVQDAAVAHWYALAPKADREKLLWVVLRHEIDYKQAARLGDAVVARTWVGGSSGLRFERHTELLRASDRGLLAKALSIWCPIDAHTRRPAQVSAEARALFSQPA
jgi:acyl-CoA thioester hydrolase